MADYYLFFAETRVAGEWIVPEAFIDESRSHFPVRELTWMKQFAPAGALFFWDDALIPFRRERPPWSDASRLYRFWFPPGYEDRELEVWWLPYEELMVDRWDESFVTVGNLVPAAVAGLFLDGDQPFPELALAAAGWDEEKVARVRRGHLGASPIDRSTGRGRYEVDASAPEHALEVTWRASVAEFLERWRVEAFRSLRRHGADADLRVVAIVG